jgi:hypothetical protein
MNRTVFVSMFNCDWTSEIRSIQNRMVALQALCTKELPAVPEDPNPLHIVLAPEYTFRKNPAQVVHKASKTYHGGNGRTIPAVFKHFKESSERNTMLSKAERELLQVQFCAATEGRNVLLVAGTIFWEETAPTFRTSSVMRKKVLVTKGVARNSCDVIYKGNVIQTYHKQINSHEFDTFEEQAYLFQHGVNGGTFEVAGLSAGVEICADHMGQQNLRAVMIERGNPHLDADQQYLHDRLTKRLEDGSSGDEFGLDLQLLVSDGMTFENRRSAIRKGGFAAHCDSRLPKSVSARNERGQFAAVDAIENNFWRFDYTPSVSFRNAKDALLRNLKFRTK